MSWARLDDRYPRHRKLRATGPLRPLCIALDVTGICHCAEYATDGFISDIDLPAVLEDSGISPGKQLQVLDKLVEVGRWYRDNERGGYWVHDFLKYNPSAAERERQAKAGRERARASRERRSPERAANVQRSNGEAPAHVQRSYGEGSVTPSPSPSPSPDVVPFLTVVGSDEEPSNQTEREGKARIPSQPPRVPRHPTDPFVTRRVREIRERQGNAAAMAYLAKVGENFGAEDKTAQLARLERWMADHPESEAEAP